MSQVFTLIIAISVLICYTQANVLTEDMTNKFREESESTRLNLNPLESYKVYTLKKRNSDRTIFQLLCNFSDQRCKKGFAEFKKASENKEAHEHIFQYSDCFFESTLCYRNGVKDFPIMLIYSNGVKYSMTDALTEEKIVEKAKKFSYPAVIDIHEVEINFNDTLREFREPLYMLIGHPSTNLYKEFEKEATRYKEQFYFLKSEKNLFQETLKYKDTDTPIAIAIGRHFTDIYRPNEGNQSLSTFIKQNAFLEIPRLDSIISSTNASLIAVIAINPSQPLGLELLEKMKNIQRNHKGIEFAYLSALEQFDELVSYDIGNFYMPTLFIINRVNGTYYFNYNRYNSQNFDIFEAFLEKTAKGLSTPMRREWYYGYTKLMNYDYLWFYKLNMFIYLVGVFSFAVIGFGLIKDRKPRHRSDHESTKEHTNQPDSKLQTERSHTNIQKLKKKKEN